MLGFRNTDSTKAPFGDFASDAAQILLWLVFAGAALALGERRGRPVLRWGGLILLGIATAVLVLRQALIANPLFTTAPVGNLVVFDALTLAYALPAVIYAIIAWLSPGPPHGKFGSVNCSIRNAPMNGRLFVPRKCAVHFVGA